MDGRQYASELLALAAGWKGRRGPTFAITSGADTRVADAERIRLLLDEIEHGRRRRILIPVATVTLLAALLPSTAIRFAGMGHGVTAPDSHGSHATTHQLRHQGHGAPLAPH